MLPSRDHNTGSSRWGNRARYGGETAPTACISNISASTWNTYGINSDTPNSSSVMWHYRPSYKYRIWHGLYFQVSTTTKTWSKPITSMTKLIINNAIPNTPASQFSFIWSAFNGLDTNTLRPSPKDIFGIATREFYICLRWSSCAQTTVSKCSKQCTSHNLNYTQMK